jgi:hypothetical protein
MAFLEGFYPFIAEELKRRENRTRSRGRFREVLDVAALRKSQPVAAARLGRLESFPLTLDYAPECMLWTCKRAYRSASWQSEQL